MSLEGEFYDLFHYPPRGNDLKDNVRTLYGKYGSRFVDLLLDEYLADNKRCEYILKEYVTLVGEESLKNGSDVERQVWLTLRSNPSVYDVVDIFTSYPDGYDLCHIINKVIKNMHRLGICHVLDKLLDAEYFILFNTIIEHHCNQLRTIDFYNANIVLRLLRKCPYYDIKYVLKLIPDYTTEAMIEEDMAHGDLSRAIIVRLFEKTRRQRKTTLIKLKHRNPPAYNYIKKIINQH